MQREEVQSSNLKSVGYENGTLEIEFQDRSVYQYFNVPENVHTELMNEESHGKYFSAYIKGKYSFKKIS